MLYYLEEKEQVLKKLGSNENGLSEKEAKERLNQNGKMLWKRRKENH